MSDIVAINSKFECPLKVSASNSKFDLGTKEIDEEF